MRRRLTTLLGAAFALSACRLFVSLDGLGDGPPEGDGASPESSIGEEAGAASDAGADHTVTPFDAAGFPGLDASFDGPDAKVFFDDFERPNADPLGNGWIERFTGAFNLVGGTAAKQTSINNYRDNIVYRPQSEDLLDVEVVAEIRFSPVPENMPMLWARAQNISANRVDGYHVYLDCCAYHFHIARHVGSVSTEIAAFDTPPLVANQTYRWTLRVTGTTSTAIYSRFEGRNDSGAWVILGQTGYVDFEADRIVTPGSVGFSGDVESGYAFDNFSRVGY
ncbi:MAG: hypothetical protein KF819_27410 [Labilithrix sp.]|nr:hypothetical protein [Labilithrix sp.]